MLSRETLKKKARARQKVVNQTNAWFEPKFKEYLSKTIEHLIDTGNPSSLKIKWTSEDLIRIRNEVTEKSACQYIGTDDDFIEYAVEVIDKYVEQELKFKFSVSSPSEDDSDEDSDDGDLMQLTFKIKFSKYDSIFESSEEEESSSDIDILGEEKEDRDSSSDIVILERDEASAP